MVDRVTLEERDLPESSTGEKEMNRIALVVLLAGVLGVTPGAFAERGRTMHGPTLQLLRNATMKLTYGEHVFLTDPMLSRKGEIRSFAGIASNPTVELPRPLEELLTGVDAVIVSHLHPDHFHRAAEQASLRNKPVLCQPEDEGQIRAEGFGNVLPVPTTVRWNGITITRIIGRHGSGPILEKMGTVSGFVFQAEREPTVLWLGDTVWCPAVRDAIRTFKPDVIVTHSGGAQVPGFEPIVMDAGQTVKTVRAAPWAMVIAVHLEALDHCRVRRQELRAAADAAGIDASRLVIPEDGEIISLRR